MTEIPEAIFHTKRRADGLWDILVDDCPFCHKKHVHGAGHGETPHMGPAYRHSHCLGRGVYRLKEVTDEATDY